MCSGIRDALTLAWHLDLVLSGKAAEATLDAYTSERRAHLQHAIAMSVELGKVICISDEAQAAARDEALMSAAAGPGTPALELPTPKLGPGIHDAAGYDGGGAAGSLFPQAHVSVDGRTCLLEDTIEGGFALYALDADPAGLLGTAELDYLDTLGCALVEIGAEPDQQDVYRRWFEANGCTVALVRPDFYVFGTAAGACEASELVRRLERSLSIPKLQEEETPA
jgi:flavoprotein hydroxylase